MNGYPPHFQDMHAPVNNYSQHYAPPAGYHHELLPSPHTYGLHPSDAGGHPSPIGGDGSDAAMLAFVNNSQSGGTSRSGSETGAGTMRGEDTASGYATSNPPSATATTFPPPVQRQLGPPAPGYGIGGSRNRTTVGTRPTDNAADPDPQHERALLLSLFTQAASNPSDPDPQHPTAQWANPYEEFDPNHIIDHIGNAPLHWACSLSRLNLVAFLLSRGADPHRGNHNGETALVRCILATNVYEAQSLEALLTLGDGAIGSTLRTVDGQHRSVLHHIAAVAGIKGRASAARYYMETVLEYVARYEAGGLAPGGGFRTLVDVQDTSGDTALNVAARVGSKALVRLLVDVGADRSLRNNLGLRAEDFGIEEEALKVSAADEAVAALRSSPPKPLQSSTDVVADVTRTIEELQSSFASEMQAKDTVLSTAQTQLLNATRELAAERKQVQALEARVWELDQVGTRIRNLQQALEDEERFCWTGRPETPSQPAAGPSFSYRPRSTVASPPTFRGPDPQVDPSRSADARQELLEMRRIKLWQSRAQSLLEQRIATVEQASAEKEVLYRKVIASCSNVPPEMVEEMLDKLVTAVESDGSSLDPGRAHSSLPKAPEQATA